MNSREISLSDLRKILLNINPRAKGRPMVRKTDLFARGILDSYSTVQFVLKLEEHLDINFDFDDIRTANFRNLTRILRLLVQKYGCTELDPDSV